VGYQSAFMFKFSMRPGTYAFRHMTDDVSEEEKTRRLTEIINLQNELSIEGNRKDVGKTFEVLIEGRSKRSDKQLCGRTSQNKMVIFDAAEGLGAGDYVMVKINDCSSATLFGELVK
jgi:tRNA-2-methylthio-N6-dimethylallyladenosine synthase